MIPAHTAAVECQTAAVPDFNAMRWQNRILLIFDDGESAATQSQEEAVQRAQSGFDERQIKVFRIIGNCREFADLRNRSGVQPSGFAAVLIGKDGSIKMRRKAFVSTDELFRIIDRMPMRKEEIRHSS